MNLWRQDGAYRFSVGLDVCLDDVYHSATGLVGGRSPGSNAIMVVLWIKTI